MSNCKLILRWRIHGRGKGYKIPLSPLWEYYPSSIQPPPPLPDAKLLIYYYYYLFREVDMSHLGFLWGKNAMQLVYNPILDILRYLSLSAYYY